MLKTIPVWCLLILAVAYAGRAEAGPWMRSEGTTHISTSLSTSTSNNQWDDDRKRARSPCTTNRQSLGVHGEYGYSYYRTVFASAAVSTKHCSGERDVNGLSDLTVGMRGRLDPYRNGRSWQLALRLPISGTTADPDRPGNGKFGLEAGVHFMNLPDPYDHLARRNLKGYWSWGAGVNAWSGGLAHQGWAYGGWSRDLSEKWRMSARMSGTASFGGSARHADGQRRNDYDKLTTSIGVRRSLTRSMGVSVSLARDLAGRNTDQATAVRLGLSRTWR